MRILLVCLGVLACVGISAAAVDEKEIEYYAILVDGGKIGHMIQTRDVEDSMVTTIQEMNMTISRGGMLLAVSSVDKNIETVDGKPVAFEFVQNVSGMNQKITGTVSGGKVQASIEMMGTNQQKTIDWPAGALMYEGLRLFEVEKGLAKGTTYEAKVFVPMLLMSAQTSEAAAVTAKISVGETANVDLFGRVVSLCEVKTIMEMPMGRIDSTGYVDADFRALKTVVPAMGMNMEIVACTKEFALSKNDVVDFISKLVIKSPVSIEKVDSCKSITYELIPNEGAKLEIPSSDNQKVAKGKNGKVTVTVEPVSGGKGDKFPYKGTDAEALESLKATAYLQSDNKEIQDLVSHAVGNTKDAAEAVKKIESFVAGFITSKNLSVGYASAAEVAQSRQGDCSEHAVLTAAMCRAAGIPARVVFGVVYVDEFLGHKNVFMGHAWAEAFVGGKWVGLDATRAPDGFGPGHIALAAGSGDPVDFFGMVNTLGHFKIGKVDIKNGTSQKEVK
jgi:hypothetical protein